jgi:DNA-binding NarL/FixJ family response regulator
VQTKLTTLSIAVLAADRLRRRCHTILARERGLRVVSHDAPLTSAPEALRRHRPDVVLLDAVTSPLEALAVLPALRRLHPTTGVIVVGRNGTPAGVILEALRRGACGHLSERDLPGFLSKAVRTVATQEAWIPRALGAAIVAELHAARPRRSRRPRRHLRLLLGHPFAAWQGDHQ